MVHMRDGVQEVRKMKRLGPDDVRCGRVIQFRIKLPVGPPFVRAHTLTMPLLKKGNVNSRLHAWKC